MALCIAICICFTNNSYAQNIDNYGTEFWVSFGKNFIGSFTQDLQITISGLASTSGTISIPGIGFTNNFNVIAGNSITINIPITAEVLTTNGIESLGINIQSNDEIAVYGLNQQQSSTDGYMAIPTDAIGNRYRIMTYFNSLVGVETGSSFQIVATQNATVVTITPSVDIQSNLAGIPYTINLNQGDVYQIINEDEIGILTDVSGTLIESNNNISVFGTAVCSNVPDINVVFCDHLVEQLPSTETWGNQFLLASLETRTNGDIYRILADVNNTQVFLDGVLQGTIQAGEILDLDLASNSFFELNTSEPVLVAQFSKGSDIDNTISDPFMMLIPPFEQYNGEVVFSTPSIFISDNYVNIVTPTTGVGILSLDGTVIPVTDFQAINANYAGVRIPISVGEHKISGENVAFGSFIYGFGYNDSYGYPGSQIYAEVAEITSLTLIPPTAELEINNQHCVTATVTDQNNMPIEGARVDFTVQGVNDIFDFGFTDSNGEVEYCYTSTIGGSDDIEALISNLNANANVIWGACCEANAGLF